jgi:cob(I)alamin adenosyltransferase
MSFKIYTKTGDDGTTGLVGGNRVSKSNLRLDAYGTVDELNSHLGMLCALVVAVDVRELILDIQNKLFVIGSKLASDDKGKHITGNLGCTTDDIRVLEQAIDAYDAELPALQNFILPGGSVSVSQCHIARTVCRRAERLVVHLSESAEIDALIIQYLNRLSDFLFVLARKLSKDQGIDEIPWSHD